MKFRYVPELDGLRGLAILAVMGFHFAGPDTRHDIITGGSLGVDIFFVLSGYLISSILLAEIDQTGGLDYRAFLMRRARRLLPALGTLLVAYALLAPFLFPNVAGRRWLDIGTAVFYVTNLRETFWPANVPLSHTWSLAIEEQFYVAWPFMILWLARFERRRVASWLFVAWVALTMARTIGMILHAGPNPYYFTPYHATGLIFGAMVAFSRPSLRVGRWASVALLALIMGGMVRSTLLIPQALAEVASILVIADAPNALSVTPMRFVGRISYGVYLWHVPLQWALSDRLTAIAGYLPATAALIATSLFAGWLSYVLVEQWFLKSPLPTRRSARISEYAADPTKS